MEIKVETVGKVKSSRSEVEDDDWDTEACSIELSEEFPEDSLDGLSDFSHVEAIFFMDQVDKAKVVTGSRHPRNRKDWPKVGIFAQRGKNQPNQIGSTICRVQSI